MYIRSCLGRSFPVAGSKVWNGLLSDVTISFVAAGPLQYSGPCSSFNCLDHFKSVW